MTDYAAMTDEQINEIIAEYVMGWAIHPRNTAFWVPQLYMKTDDYQHVIRSEWKPSTDIASAFQVVEKMREKNWLFHCSNHSDSWGAEFWFTQEWREHCEKVDSSLPRAICLAALSALKALEAK